MSKRTTLLTTAAAAALVGAMTSGAWAFDVVDWNWKNTVTQATNIGVNISISQANGDVGQYEGGQIFVGSAATNAVENGNNPNNIDNYTVNNAALSAGNLQSAHADDGLLIHTGQYTLGGFNGASSPNPSGFATAIGVLAAAVNASSTQPLIPENENDYVVFALAALAAAGNGYITPASIGATATASATYSDDLTNSATAMGNSASWNITGVGVGDPSEGGNDGPIADNIPGVLIGDITQLAFANVSGSASASGIYPNSGPATLDNLATAVGNNLSVRVNSPALD